MEVDERVQEGSGVTEVPVTTDSRTDASTTPEPQPGGPSESRTPEAKAAVLYLRVTLVVTVGMVAGALLEWLPDDPSPWRWLPLGAAYLVGGGPILQDTLKSLREGRLSIDFLMGAAALGAAAVGQPLEGVILIFLFSLSNTLEAYAMGRTRRAIARLMELHPEEVTLVNAAGEPIGRVAAADLTPKQRILVRPGERIGADGRVVAGRSEVDQSAITGESMPVSRATGDEVYAGTINQDGVLTVEVTRPAGDTMLARIVRLVEEAREDRAPAQEFIDRFAHPYTLLVLGGSAASAVLGALVFGLNWGDSIYRAMTLLVVASPCALVISTPAALLSGIANGARNGILFKGGAYLDLAGTVDTVAFDKTGTLTEGRPRLLAITGGPAGLGEAELLRLAASVEEGSEHHLARAVLEAARVKQVDHPRAEDFQSFPGEGVLSRVEGRRVWIGNAEMARREDARVPEWLNDWSRDEAQAARSVVFIGEGSKAIGGMAFGDRLRPGARATVARLRGEGVRWIAVLSGDHPSAVEAVVRELEPDEVLAGLLPHQKVEALKRLAGRSRGVAMVGDGVNDAPAMATATIGVAMGAAGTDVAIETADVVLMSDDLEKVGDAILLGRRTRRVVRQNVWFSVGWMALLVGAASTVGMPLTLAVIAHEGSTILVVLNGLRLLRGS